MMITIHGFPAKTKYQDVKLLIKQECSINDFILDNLINDSDGTKKVRIGLTDNTEGYKVMKCLDGYRMPGNFVLKAIPVGKVASIVPPQPSSFDSRPSYQSQPKNDYSSAPRNDYMSQPANDYQGSLGTIPSHSHGGIHGSRPSQGGPHSGPHVSGGPQGTIDSMNRPSPWVSGGGSSNQWNTPMAAQVPQNTFGFTSPQANVNPSYGQQPVHPRPSFNQSRADQGYGYTPKSNVPEVVPPVRPPETRHALRNIETVDTSSTHPPVHNRYPASQAYQQDKPLTIMKDNFQGPTQYNITNPGGHTSSHSGPGGQHSQYPSTAPSPWQSQSQPSKAPFSKPSSTVYDKQYDDRKYIQPDARDASKSLPIRTETQDRRTDTYKDYEKRRGFSPRRSPTGRRISPESVRRLSPTARRVSPTARRASPTARRASPPGRQISPHARKFSPPGKRVSPDRRVPVHHPARRESPHKRSSPMRRLVSPPPPRREELSRRGSPPRRDDPQRMPRYSPDRHPEKLDKYGSDKLDKYAPDKLKQVRPAYEPSNHASNQAMYSGGYRPGGREPVQYPVPMHGMRQAEPRMSPWQRERDEPPAPMKKQDDRRDLTRLQMRDRIPDTAVDAKHTPTLQRKSRSPIRRDRSPLRERYKRHSLSPLSSHSPRRSWALEKRRSPQIRDAPPPPSWPGQNVRDTDYQRTNRPNFSERDQADKSKPHVPIWETRPFEKVEETRVRRPDNAERRPFLEDKIRPIKDLPVREVVIHPNVPPYRLLLREPKFTPRGDYDAERGDNYRRRETSVDRKPHSQREDYETARRPRELEEHPHPDEYHRRREPSITRHDSAKEQLSDPIIDKDFEDIYKRAMLFKKKSEELRRLGSKRRDDFLADDHGRSHHTDREREERPQRYEERHRFQEDELRARDREDRPHDDMPRDDKPRDDRPRDDRPRDEGPRRADYRRDDYLKKRNEEKRFSVNPNIRIKRDKAVKEICNKILDRHESYQHVKGEQKLRVLEELQLAIARIVFDMFGDNDVSFIEIIIKYQAKYNLKDEEKILQEVMSSLPSQYRTIKRQAPELSDVPAKTRRSQSPNMKLEQTPRPKLSESRWSMNILPPEVVTMPVLGNQPPIRPAMNPGMVPMMVPAPFIHPYDTLPQNPAFMPEQFHQPPEHFHQPLEQFYQPPPQLAEVDEGFKVYLCKDDFEQITPRQADALKDYLISQMLRQTEISQGWAPDFTLKGLQNSHRYELITKDDSTKDWVVNLDFSGFTEFHVIVYTKEELWYERAAVWLPGHSRYRNLEPLDKLKLQNKRLEGVNIAKWKFVKKIVTQKGTRLYVDMPPSSARTLEKHKMMLSYELQQVNVFLKAVAVDKDAFDAGLKEPSTEDFSLISSAIQNSPMPSLAYDPALIKITLKGCKTLTLVQARKIKEVLIYQLYRHHQQDGAYRTDFDRYGFFPPNCFGVIPQNPESKKWLLSQHLGKVNRQVVVVMGAEEENTRFFKMNVHVPNEHHVNPAIALERIKQSNQGLKGINFNIWKPLKLIPDRKNKVRLDVDIDLDSLETLSKMKYQLDYVDLMNMSHTAYFKYEYSYSVLEEQIAKYRAEMTDSYDIANMDLDSNSDDDIICLD